MRFTEPCSGLSHSYSKQLTNLVATKQKTFHMLDLVQNPATGVYAVAPPPAAPGVVNLTQGKLFDIFTVPPVLSYTSASDNGSGAATVTQYIFNNNVMTAAVTTNGSGAGSIVNTYGDGYTGKIYEQLQRSANGGRGILIKGFTVTSTTTSTGAQYSTAINTMNMQILNANAQGGSTPVPVSVASALRNSQFQVGVYTVAFEFYLNALSQISVSLPANTTFAFQFITQNGSL